MLKMFQEAEKQWVFKPQTGERLLTVCSCNRNCGTVFPVYTHNIVYTLDECAFIFNTHKCKLVSAAYNYRNGTIVTISVDFKDRPTDIFLDIFSDNDRVFESIKRNYSSPEALNLYNGMQLNQYMLFYVSPLKVEYIMHPSMYVQHNAITINEFNYIAANHETNILQLLPDYSSGEAVFVLVKFKDSEPQRGGRKFISLATKHTRGGLFGLAEIPIENDEFNRHVNVLGPQLMYVTSRRKIFENQSFFAKYNVITQNEYIKLVQNNRMVPVRSPFGKTKIDMNNSQGESCEFIAVRFYY